MVSRGTVLAATLFLVSCGGVAPTPSPDPAMAFAIDACGDTTYANCVEGIVLMSEQVPGSTVAICEYQDDQGDVVILEDATAQAAAEDWCSGDGAFSPSRVFAIVKLP